jgi:hypothetical protein
MAITIGTITSIKVGSVRSDTDQASITVTETSTNLSWLFNLWISRNDEPALQRILQSQRLALIREAAFRKLTVHIVTGSESNQQIDSFTIDIP